MEAQVEMTTAPAIASPDLSALVIPLLKGVLYQEADAALWNALLNLQPRVRDYVAVLDLELVLDEAEGYAFLRSRPQPEEGDGHGCRGWSRGARCRFRSACCWRCCARSWPSSTPAAATRGWCSRATRSSSCCASFCTKAATKRS
jgi:hypothetical protein